MAKAHCTTARPSTQTPRCPKPIKLAFLLAGVPHHSRTFCRNKDCPACRPWWIETHSATLLHRITAEKPLCILRIEVDDQGNLLGGNRATGAPQTVKSLWRRVRRLLKRKSQPWCKITTERGVWVLAPYGMGGLLLPDVWFESFEWIRPYQKAIFTREFVAASLPGTHFLYGGEWAKAVKESKEKALGGPRPMKGKKIPLPLTDLEPEEVDQALTELGIPHTVTHGPCGSMSVDWRIPEGADQASHIYELRRAALTRRGTANANLPAELCRKPTAQTAPVNTS